MQESVNQNRDKYIGGSDIPVIMEISPFKSRFDLLLEKAGYKKNEFEGNIFTDYGNKMEEKIRDYVSAIGNAVFMEGKHIKDIPESWNAKANGMQIRAHTDGEFADIILEIKTTSQIYDNLDDYQIYLVQLLFYMYVTGKENGMLAVYERPDDMNEEFEVDHLQLFSIKLSDYESKVNEIIQAVVRFLDDLEKVKSNPFITEDELLPAEIPEITSRIIAFEQQISRMKELEKKIKSEKARLKTAMETAGVKKWETPNGTKITLIADTEDKAVKEPFFNAERFMSEHPELVDQYMEEKTTIQKGKAGYVKITLPKEAKK